MPDSRVHERPIPVVAGFIRNAQQEILLARRPLTSDQGGLWEFPGGKVRAGEGSHEALQRELSEELGIIVENSTPLISVHHAYPEKTIQLQLRQVTAYHGSVSGLEGQQIRWLPEDALHSVAMPAADARLLNALGLPDYYLISGPWAGESSFPQRLEQVLQKGRRLIQLRLPGCSSSALKLLAESTAKRCRQAGAQLLINEHIELAAATAATGVHLKSAQLMECTERPLPGNRLVAASCHNEAELHHACRLGLDFICISPVLETSSHPRAEPLGWEQFERLCQLSTLPVYALGGLSEPSLTIARQAGAKGVAGISGFWNGA